MCFCALLAPALCRADDELIIIDDEASELIIITDDETPAAEKSVDIEKRLFQHEPEAKANERLSLQTQTQAFADIALFSVAQLEPRFESNADLRYVFDRRLVVSAGVFAKAFVQNAQARGFADLRELSIDYRGENLSLALGKIIVPLARTQIVGLSDRLNPIDQRRAEHFAPFLRSRLPRWGAHLRSQAGPFDLEFAFVVNEQQKTDERNAIAHFARYQDAGFAALSPIAAPSSSALLVAKTRALSVDFGAQLLSQAITNDAVPALSFSIFGAKSFGLATFKSEILFEPNTPFSSGLNVLVNSSEGIEQNALNHVAGALSVQGDLFNYLGGAVEIFARHFSGIGRGHSLLGLETLGQRANETQNLTRGGLAFTLAGSVLDGGFFWDLRGESGTSLSTPANFDLRTRILLGARIFDSPLQAGLRADVFVGAEGTPGALASDASRVGFYLSTAP